MSCSLPAPPARAVGNTGHEKSRPTWTARRHYRTMRITCTFAVLLAACNTDRTGGVADLFYSTFDSPFPFSPCNDFFVDGTETDIDCGGGECQACVQKQKC